MMRKRIKLAWISNATSRRATFRKRSQGLAKKMDELTILCGVEGCVLIFNPEGEDLFVWPSCEKATELLTKFDNMPKAKKGKKTLNHARYMEERNKKLHQDILKLEKRNMEMKASLIMYVINCQGKRPEELTEEECYVLKRFTEEKLKDIRRRTHLLPPAPCSIATGLDMI